MANTADGSDERIDFEDMLKASLRFGSVTREDIIQNIRPGETSYAGSDGANIWVTNFASNNMTKRRAGDGALLGARQQRTSL